MKLPEDYYRRGMEFHDDDLNRGEWVGAIIGIILIIFFISYLGWLVYLEARAQIINKNEWEIQYHQGYTQGYNKSKSDERLRLKELK